MNPVGAPSAASAPSAPSDAADPADPADPLAAIIALLRPKSVLSKIVSGAGPWSVRYAAQRHPAFSVIVEGACFLDADVDGGGALELAEGDFVFFPEVPAFTLASDRSLTPTPVVPEPVREIRRGTAAGPPTMRLLGGFFRFDRANAQLLARLLPPIVHVPRRDSAATRLHRIVELICDEASHDRPGRGTILERLVEVLLAEALRLRLPAAGPREQGLIAGLSDPALARPLRRIHVDIARRWTVAELARTAGMSRAVFAERFTRLVGIPPMRYLLEWRMAVAKDLLRRARSRAPLAEIAERVGYQSASAFSAAFTRATGCAPSEFARSPDAAR